MTVRADLKETCTIEGTVQTLDFQNDLNAVFALKNSSEITDTTPVSVSSLVRDSLLNGFIWQYTGNNNASKNTLNLYAVINNVLQDRPILKIDQATQQVYFDKSLSIINSDGTTSPISSGGVSLTDVQNWVTSQDYLIASDLSAYVESTALTTTLADYATTSSLSNVVTTAGLTTALSSYATTASLNTALTAALSNYITSASLTTTLSSYVTSAALTTALGSIGGGGAAGNIKNHKDVTTTPYTIATTDYFLSVKTSSTPMLLALPSSPSVGECVKIMDATGNAVNNNISILGNILNPKASLATLASLTPGTSPVKAMFSPDSTYAYIVNSGSNNVTVISGANTLTPTFLKNITVGNSPKSIVATSTGVGFVTNSGSNNISVIQNMHTSNPTVLKTLATGNNPQAIEIAPNQNYGYVLNASSNTATILYSMSDAIGAGVAYTAFGGLGSTPNDAAFTPDSEKVLIANLNSANVTIIKDASYGASGTTVPTVLDTLVVGNNPYKILVTPNGKYAYVLCYGSNAVYIIAGLDTDTPFVADNLAVGTFSTAFLNKSMMAMTSDGNYLYVANSGGTTISVFKDISTDNPTLLTTLNCNSYPGCIAISNDNTKAYVVNQNQITLIQNVNTLYPSILANFSASSSIVVLPPDGSNLLSVGSYLTFSRLASVLNTNFASAELIYNGSQWAIA